MGAKFEYSLLPPYPSFHCNRVEGGWRASLYSEGEGLAGCAAREIGPSPKLLEIAWPQGWASCFVVRDVASG